MLRALLECGEEGVEGRDEGRKDEQGRMRERGHEEITRKQVDDSVTYSTIL